ncbi:MAG: ABC transporter permease [Roseitalea sp.]|jgi:simple sugar transport system permease protein|nr:ABC transporter permease [Roseitalea sp.]MBO6721113.1 ABC transporter permease [Roseitalea sp.]MBO6744171.1 ABC transporter permease [Roseitalea sp.]
MELGYLLRQTWFGAFLAAIFVYIFFAFFGGANGFTSIGGTAGWLNTAAELGIIAVPIGLLMIAGEFDLSTGSVVGAASIIVAMCTSFFGFPVIVGIFLALAMGVGVGLFNAALVHKTSVPSFIVTLATNFIVAGTALALSRVLSGSSTVSIPDAGWAEVVFATRWNQMYISIIWWIAATALATWVLKATPFGNWIFAIGGSNDSAQRAGVPIWRVKRLLYVWTGVSAALVGVMTAIQFNQGNAVAGQSYVFQTAIAAVIGGVLLTGGFGSVIGVVFGCIIYGTITIGLFYTGWPTDWSQAFIGSLLVVAVLANNAIRDFALKSKN